MIAIALAMAFQLGDLADFPDRAKYASLPREVRVLMDRRQACLYWGGEFSGDYSDPETGAATRIRDRQIISTQRKLRCGIVEGEEARLRRRYATAPAILKALDETRDWLP